MSNLFETLITRSWEQRLLKKAIRLGREEGANGRPAADTPKYDVGETHVRGEIEKQVVKAGEGVSTELQKIVPTITKKDGDLSQVELTFQSKRSVIPVSPERGADPRAQRGRCGAGAAARSRRVSWRAAAR